MSKELIPNKVTSHLTDDEKQNLYKNARAEAWYDNIWKTVGKCVFCDLKDKYILHEENGVVLTVNIYPYIDGQMMAIPRRHISSPKELTPLEWETMRKFSYISKKIIRKVHGHKAMWNLIREGGEAGQMTVSDHLHMQLIPFDAKDLCVWNFRNLKNTPLENVKLYKDNAKEFISAYEKFDKKYSKSSSQPVVVDLLIIHNKKVLVQKRKEEFRFKPDIYTLPGGHIEAGDQTLLDALSREVKDEIHYDLDQTKLQLVNSELSQLTSELKVMGRKNIVKNESFIWNTYLLTEFDETQILRPDDDCEEIIWIELDKIEAHTKISPQLKRLISNVVKTKR